MSAPSSPPDPWGILDELRALRRDVSEQRTEIAELRDELRRREVGEFLTQAQLAKRLGLKPAALSMRIARRKSELCSLAIEIDGRRMWRLADLEALEQRGNK